MIIEIGFARQDETVKVLQRQSKILPESVFNSVMISCRVEVSVAMYAI
jgi:hypothetical protein